MSESSLSIHPAPHEAPVPDELFALHLGKMGGASPEQLAAAQVFQYECSAKGSVLSLADVLVQQGIITTAMRENVEKKVQLLKLGGHSQLGQFKLLRKLGEGGMGAVYLAENSTNGVNVALKVLPEKHASDAEFVTRFRREARATSKLHHPNIISASELGEDAGTLFYAMEYCEGEALDGKLSRAVFLPWKQALDIVLQVAQGLKCAHEHGFVHRDIKPANIFITSGAIGGVAKILDLGLTKNIADTEQSFNTMSGIALGTPHYISPEQARGSHGIDGRSDIYSLGATLYQLVTGSTPFDGNTAALIMMKHLSAELPNPQDLREDIPDGVVQVIVKMMAKEPDDRYDNCNDLIADLELVQAGQPPKNVALGVGKSSVAMRASRMPASSHHDPTLLRQPIAAAATGRPTAIDTPSVPGAATKSKSMIFVLLGAAVFAAILVLILLNGGRGSKDAGGTPSVAQAVAQAAENRSALKLDEAWIQKTSALTGDTQLNDVFTKLRAMNPEFNNTWVNKNWKYGKDGAGIVNMVRFPTGAGVTDISPLLAFLKLETLDFDFQPQRDGPLLREFKALKRVNGLPLEEILKRSTPMQAP